MTYSPKIKAVLDMQRKHLEREKYIKEYFCQKILNKITFLCNNNEYYCIYKIDKFVLGYPKFDVKNVTHYLRDYLLKQGLYCIIASDNVLFIVWEINLITKIIKESKRVKFEGEKKISDLKSLINIKI